MVFDYYSALHLEELLSHVREFSSRALVGIATISVINGP
jgi:hypothetical protein